MWTNTASRTDPVHKIWNSARTREEMRSMPTRRTEHADYMNYGPQKNKATTAYMGNRAGCDHEMKIAECFPIDRTGDFSQETEKRVGRSNNTTSFYPVLHYPQTSRFKQEQNQNLSKYQATVPTKTCSFDNTSPLNEERSSLVNIKITSAFSLNPNISNNPIDTEQNMFKFEPNWTSKVTSKVAPFPVLWQPEIETKNAMVKNDQIQKASFAAMTNNRKEQRGSQISIHFDEDVDDLMFSEIKLKHRQQGYTRLAISQDISAEHSTEILNKKAPNHCHTYHERSGPSPSPRQDRGIEPMKEFLIKRNDFDLHENVPNHFPEKLENVLCTSDDHPNTKYSQTAPIGNNQSPVSVKTCQQDTAKSLSFVAIKRTKHARASDESIATDMTEWGMPSSLITTPNDQHLPIVSSQWSVDKDTQWDSNAQRRLVDYTGKARLPWQLKKLSPENLLKFKMKNEVPQRCEVYQHTSTTTSPLKKMDKVGQKKTLNWKSMNPKIKFQSAQILITPQPELFENLEKELSSENDEEPVVEIPNYFLDFTIKCTQDNPLTPELANSSNSKATNVSPPNWNEMSKPDCYPTHKKDTLLEHKKLKEIAIKAPSKFAGVREPPKKQAMSFLRKPLPKESAFHFFKDDEPKSILTSHVYAGIPVNELPPQSNSPMPVGLRENQQYDPLIPTRIYRRIGGAHPSIKPTPDFSRLLPTLPRKIVCEYPTRQEFVADSVRDKQAEDTSISLPQHRCQNVQDASVVNNTSILPETESSKFIGLTTVKFTCQPSGNCCLNGSSDKQINPTCTETSVEENVTSEFYDGRKHQCEVGRAFGRSNTLTTHKRIQTGDRPFPCDLCGRAFRQLGNLTRHKLTHSAVKPHACPKCNKSFSSTSNLNTHLRTHTNFKPFVCDMCGKGFHQKVDMKIHRYTHTGEKPHKCGTCGRGFKQLTHLRYHMRTHSDERLYKCQHCGKGFNQKGNLQAHIYGHTGKRPYRCDICGKGFTLTSTLNTHKLIHAPDKPFKCEFCDKAFYQKNSLKTHYISSHPYTDGVCLL